MKEYSYGIIPFYKTDNGWETLVIYQHGSAGDLLWTFPKGKIEEGEEGPRTACRELKEETGLTAEIMSKKKYAIPYSFVRDGVNVDKVTTYYIGNVTNKELTLQEKEVKDAKWLTPKEARAQLTYEGHKKLLDEVLRDLDFSY